jgi:hypothetical protein
MASSTSANRTPSDNARGWSGHPYCARVLIFRYRGLFILWASAVSKENNVTFAGDQLKVGRPLTARSVAGVGRRVERRAPWHLQLALISARCTAPRRPSRRTCDAYRCQGTADDGLGRRDQAARTRYPLAESEAEGADDCGQQNKSDALAHVVLLLLSYREDGGKLVIVGEVAWIELPGARGNLQAEVTGRDLGACFP